MNYDEIQNLLWKTDQLSACPPLRNAVARRVWRRSARRRVVRRATAASVSLLWGGCLLWAFHAHSDNATRRTIQPLVIAPSPPSSASLEAAANLAQRTADDILTLRRYDLATAAAAAAARIDPVDRLNEEADQTALTLLMIGDQMAQQPSQTQHAAAVYQRVRRAFPKTPSAAAAAQRLRELQLGIRISI